MRGTAPTSQDCLTAHRRAADLDAHPPVPIHSLSTTTVTLVSLLSFQSPSQRRLAVSSTRKPNPLGLGR